MSRIARLLPVLTSAAEIPWYLKGGVAAANCIAAYKAIGAASLAASYINLANPGTYDITTASAPTFDTATGWTFDGAANVLSTNYTPANNANVTHTIIARFSNAAAVTGYVIGMNISTAQYMMIAPSRGSRKYYNGQSGDTLSVGADTPAGVQAMAGGNCYLNGVAEVGSPFVAGNAAGSAIKIGQTTAYFNGKVQAAAIYDTVLTPTQVLAISNAMAALPFDVTYPAFPGATPADTSVGEFMVAFFSDPHTGSPIPQGVTASQLNTMMAYLKNQASYLGLQAVLCGGDMTDQIEYNAANQADFMSALSKLDDIPHLVAIGNHDYNLIGGARTSTLYNADLPQSYYTGKSWWAGGFCEVGRSENSYLLLTIGAVDYIFLNLEWFPRQAVVDWADTLLTTHAARKAIIVTHAYEYMDSTPYAIGDTAGPDGQPEICGADYNWGTDIWTELLNIHDNIILIHSGHIGSAARHVTNSAGGQPVNQVLFDYQSNPLYTTMMRFMVFNPTTETIKVETFSPVLLTKMTDASNQFTLTY